MGPRQEKLFINALGVGIFLLIVLFLPNSASATTNISGSSTTGVASWTNTTVLQAGTIREHSSIVSGGYAYVIGGFVGGVSTSAVSYAPISSNGTLGSWINTTALPSISYEHSSEVWNGYAYAIGGTNQSGTSTMRFAQINSDGTLGSWSYTNYPGTTIYNHSSAAYNGYLYAIGGTQGGAVSNAVLFAPINATGSLGSWQNTTVLSQTTQDQSSVAYNGYLYVLGGRTGALLTPTANTYYAPINSTGSLGSWTTTTVLPVALYDFSVVVYGGNLYVIGGDKNGSGDASPNVYYAPINSTGSLGSWVTTTALPTSTYDHSSIVKNGYIYNIGGFNIGGVATSTVLYANANPSGNYWAWNDAIGWIDFFHTNNVTVNSNNLVGYASSSAGEVTLDCATAPTNVCGKSQYQVTNDGAGNLSNWGWNDKYGWISFDCHNGGSGCSKSNYEAYIDGNGDFQNYAWNDTIGWISFNCANTGGCATSNYKVNTSWASTSTNGYVDSTTYDTGIASGAQLNSVLWHGSQPGGTAVRFQFATSNSSSGPWNFIGTDGTSNTYYSTGPDVSLDLDYSLHNNFRYFRYRVKLFSNTAGTVSPRVDEVIVNWSP